MKNKTIFFKKWPSTGSLDGHLAKSLSPWWLARAFSLAEYEGTETS